MLSSVQESTTFLNELLSLKFDFMPILPDKGNSCDARELCRYENLPVRLRPRNGLNSKAHKVGFLPPTCVT